MARTVARSIADLAELPKVGPVELVGLAKLVHEPDDLVRMADRVRGELRRDDEVDGALLRLLEVEQPPRERLAQRPRPGVPLERNLDQLDLVLAVAQALDERLGEDLRAAPLERDLRHTDGDSHSLGSGRSSRGALSSSLSAALESLDIGLEAFSELVDERQDREIERALLGREWLDVPSHQLPQHPLDRRDRLPRSPAVGLAFERTLRPSRPRPLAPGSGWQRHALAGSARPARVGRPSLAHLGLEPREDRGDLGVRVSGASSSITRFYGAAS